MLDEAIQHGRLIGYANRLQSVAVRATVVEQSPGRRKRFPGWIRRGVFSLMKSEMTWLSGMRDKRMIIPLGDCGG